MDPGRMPWASLGGPMVLGFIREDEDSAYHYAMAVNASAKLRLLESRTGAFPPSFLAARLARSGGACTLRAMIAGKQMAPSAQQSAAPAIRVGDERLIKVLPNAAKRVST